MYAWSDKSPVLFDNWLNVKLIIDSLEDVMPETRLEFNEFDREQITESMLSLTEKINYIKDYNASTNSTQCAAVFNNIATPSTWVPIGCNNVFQHNYFLCERHIVNGNGNRTREEFYKVIPRHFCHKHMILESGYCWLIKPTVRITYIISYQSYRRPTIDNFLTSLFLGSRGEIYIGLYLNIETPGMSTCLTPQSHHHQKYRGWNTVPCIEADITHRLLQYRAEINLSGCDRRRHFMCGDGSCITKAGLCNGKRDCRDNADEIDCNILCPTEDRYSGICENSYLCRSEQTILLSFRCDGVAHCNDSSDEEHCSFVVIPRNDIDGYISDLLQLKRNGKCGRNMLMCDLTDDGFCYHQHNWCVYEVLHDSVLHCPGLQHLHFCETYECPNMFQCTVSYCIPMYMTCNGISDCPEGCQH